MSIQHAKYPRRKKQYIFVEGNELIPTNEVFQTTGELVDFKTNKVVTLDM